MKPSNKKRCGCVIFAIALLAPLIWLSSCSGGGQPKSEPVAEIAEAGYWQVAMTCAASKSQDRYPEVSRLSFEEGESWWALVREKEAVMLPGGTRLESAEQVSDGLSKIKVGGGTWFVSSGFLEFVEP